MQDFFDSSQYSVLLVQIFTVTYRGLCEIIYIENFDDFRSEKIIFDCHMDEFFDILNKIELRLSESGKPRVF